MFSTSITASSTTTPIAIARPPRVMVSSEAPSRSSTRVAASSESGIAVQEIAAVRRSNRNRNRTTITSTAPTISESLTLLVAVLMKFAGRKRSLWIVIPSASSAGRSSCSAASTFCVTLSVSAAYCSATLRITPGRPWIPAPPIGGSGASTTSATFPKVMLAAPRLSEYGPGNVVGLERLSLALKDDPLIFGVDEAGPPNTG